MKSTAASIFIGLALAAIPFSAFSSSYNWFGWTSQRVRITCILNENSRAEWNGRSATINELVVSADGSKLAFTVDLASPWERRLYLMDAGGGGLTDISASLPGVVNSSFKVNWLQFNHDGSRLFFVWNWLHDIHYYEGGSCQLVVDGITNADTRKPFAIDEDGTKAFFRDARWNDALQKTIRGLYFVEIGGDPMPLFDVDDLPCEDDPPISAWYTRLAFLDCAPDGSALFFRWVIGESPYDKHSLFRVPDGGTPEMYLPEEHEHICSSAHGLKNRIVSHTGEHFLCAYHDADEPWELVLLSSDHKTPIAKTWDPNGFAYTALLGDGSGARFFARAGFRHTLWLPTLREKRDTFSALIPGDDPFSEGFIATDLIKDNHTYIYFALTRANNVDMIYRVKKFPAEDNYLDFKIDIDGYDRQPFYTDESEPMTVFAKLYGWPSLDAIEWVRLQSLVDGREYKDWHLENPLWTNVPPISYDPEFNDDGTQGDKTADDGVFTNNTIQLQLASGFYNAYPFPCYPGIRIVAKDTDHNYTLTDGVFEVTERSLCEGNTDDDSDTDGLDLANYIDTLAETLLSPFAFADDFGRRDCPP
jgi:hypothetical protein